MNVFIAGSDSLSARDPQCEVALRGRILESLQARPGQDGVVLAWTAYLAGLLEWNILDPHTHGRLFDLLPKRTGWEIAEVLMGPDFVDELRLAEGR